MGGLCTDSLWRGYRFAMNNIKKSKNISGEAYIQSFDANARVLINLSIFWLVFIMAAIGPVTGRTLYGYRSGSHVLFIFTHVRITFCFSGLLSFRGTAHALCWSYISISYSVLIT